MVEASVRANRWALAPAEASLTPLVYPDPSLRLVMADRVGNYSRTKRRNEVAIGAGAKPVAHCRSRRAVMMMVVVVMMFVALMPPPVIAAMSRQRAGDREDTLFGSKSIAAGRAQQQLYVTINQRIDPSFEVVPNQTLKIAERSIGTMTKFETQAALAQTYKFAQDKNMGFHMSYIGEDAPKMPGSDFDTERCATFMRMVLRKRAATHSGKRNCRR